LQAVLDPLAVWFLRGGEFFDVGVAQEFFVDRIDRDYFSGGEAPFFNDRFFGNVADADF
jgi:hypothetical protein